MKDRKGESSPAVLGVALLLLLVGLLIFRDFVFGEKLLLYKDIGADSINDTYPTFVHLSDYLRQHGFPSWSFCVGMGQSLFYLAGCLIWAPVVWLPRHLIASGLVFEHLLMALIAGLFFFRFLRLRGLVLQTSLGGALFLAFSAHMCMGSCWIISANDTVCFAFVLLAAEEAIIARRWFYLPIAVALSGLVTVFHLYLSAVLLCLYVPARLVEIRGWKPAAVASICACLALAASLGVGLGAIIFLPASYSILNSPRASGAVSNFAFGPAPSLFQLGSPLYYVTAALRSFSSDLLGTGDGYRGWENYYEGPLSYCGLFPLLLLPQAFFGPTRRQRVLYAVFSAMILIPMVFPWFRYLFWLERGAYFRTFSLFSIFALLVLSMTAWQRYLERGALNFWVLGGTLAVFLGFLHGPIPQIQAVIEHGLAWHVTFLLLLYAVLLGLGRIWPRRDLIGWIILLVAAIELVHFDRGTVNRPTVAKHELQERVGYNDETIEAVRFIRANDQGFFRLTKTWGSGGATRPSLNDALVFGYYGTASYSSYNSLNYVNFLLAVEAIDPANAPVGAQWSLGLVGHPLLLAFACEKYLLAQEAGPFENAEQYELLRREGKISLFRNRSFLPFGLVFGRYLAEDTFLQMPGWAKPQALLHAAVLSGSAARRAQIPELPLDDLKQRLREISVLDAMAQCQATALNIQSFDQTWIKGTVSLSQKGVLLCQMPFDDGWHASVDGHSSPTFKADVGLLGVVLEEGDHRVELNYRPPFLYTGILLSIISCAFFAWALRRWPRLERPG